MRHLWSRQLPGGVVGIRWWSRQDAVVATTRSVWSYKLPRRTLDRIARIPSTQMRGVGWYRHHIITATHDGIGWVRPDGKFVCKRQVPVGIIDQATLRHVVCWTHCRRRIFYTWNLWNAGWSFGRRSAALVSAFALSPDGRIALVAHIDHFVCMHSVDSWRLMYILTFPKTESITSVAWDHAGLGVASCGLTGTVRYALPLLDLRLSAFHVHKVGIPLSCVSFAGHAHLVLGDVHGGMHHIQLQTNELEHKQTDHGSIITSLACQNGYLLIGDLSGVISLWEY